ncbi:inositol monophosphatase family protein [Oleisolibacter albus]|uniref:inositol monophosphatase family protein n=1 Tax=Oleisolibacter albus TaxID=2171757 RepID=UPI000DF33214|nr:inositol monophosphatase family protein [Oleisolibacter albus]
MSTAPVPTAACALAIRLADAAGAVVRRHYRTPIAIDVKADESPVTAADRGVEAAIRAILTAERPQDGILGEEQGSHGLDKEWVWVIDPIDGTKSFISGRPLFTTLIGLLHHGVPVLGVIDQAITGDRWVGVDGQPTTLNGQPIRTRTCPSLSVATMGATMPFPQPGFARVQAASRYTVWGGDAYAFGLLAAGFLDVMVEASLQPYDWAALVPVITGAGGVITDWQGQPLRLGTDGTVAVAGDPHLHAAVLDLLRAD